MSNAAKTPWSDNPNAPMIPYALYLGEKAYFAGFLLGAIFYGIVIVLFFQCMGAFFDPINRARGGIQWVLVIHTAAMFLFATMYTALSSNIQSISFIDNRAFPASINGVPGPLGYQFFIHDKAVGIAPTPTILLMNWLADGLLLYRCHVVYVKNYWVMAFPFLMYLASIATSILLNYEVSRSGPVPTDATIARFGAPHFSISVAFNILLALMIIARLTMHRRNIQKAIGTQAGAGGLYTAIITTLVESYSLALVVAILYIGTWAAKSYFQYIFLQVFAQAQVIAPFLITLRIANRRAVTSDTFASDNDSIRFRSRGNPRGGDGTFSGPYSVGSIDADEPGVGVETAINIHHDEVSGSEGSSKA